jgi:hypothetical protein
MLTDCAFRDFIAQPRVGPICYQLVYNGRVPMQPRRYQWYGGQANYLLADLPREALTLAKLPAVTTPALLWYKDNASYW